MRLLWIFIILWLAPALSGQHVVSFDSCLEMVIKNHPRYVDQELLGKISNNNSENYMSAWLPGMSLNGQATYQSDVIGIDFNSPVPGFDFPTAPKDQYKVYVDLRQTLYDAGKVEKSREIESLKLKSFILQSETEIEKAKASLIDVYYAALSLQESIGILNVSRELLKRNLEILETAVQSGTALPADTDLLEVALLELEQDTRNLMERRSAAISVLCSLTGLSFDTERKFGNTGFSFVDTSLNRKELLLLDENKKVFELTGELIKSNRLPVAFAFGQFGYGNPGLNMLKNEFDTWYYLGIGLKWTIWDWNVSRRERENMTYQSELIDNRQKELIQNIERAKINYLAELRVHQGNIAQYEGMLSLREGITNSYEIQLREGTIRAIDYLAVANEEKILKIKLNNERILLQKTIAEYLLLTGNL